MCSWRWKFRNLLPRAGQYQDVGIIPAGKFSIRVQLESTGGQDLDITLFDTTSTSEFSEGAAIVAWCSSPATCNAGVLGLEAVPDSATYKDMSIRYSGYNGQNGNRGSEWIEISGETTVDMSIRYSGYNGQNGNRGSE